MAPLIVPRPIRSCLRVWRLFCRITSQKFPDNRQKTAGMFWPWHIIYTYIPPSSVCGNEWNVSHSCATCVLSFKDVYSAKLYVNTYRQCNTTATATKHESRTWSKYVGEDSVVRKRRKQVRDGLYMGADKACIIISSESPIYQSDLVVLRCVYRTTTFFGTRLVRKQSPKLLFHGNFAHEVL